MFLSQLLHFVIFLHKLYRRMCIFCSVLMSWKIDLEKLYEPCLKSNRASALWFGGSQPCSIPFGYAKWVFSEVSLGTPCGGWVWGGGWAQLTKNSTGNSRSSRLSSRSLGHWSKHTFWRISHSADMTFTLFGRIDS